jgi:glycine/D-amino acid oxidase-like deaminating enzyme
LIDQGRIPHPDAASTDISKVVRMDYGADAQHTAMGEASVVRWRAWNSKWGETLFHEDGLLVMSRTPLRPGTFEGDSHALLTSRGHELCRTSQETLHAKHPAWNTSHFNDGYFNPEGGWVESGKVIARLAIEAREVGVEIVENVAVPRPMFDGARCTGIESGSGERWLANCLLVAAGAWTPLLLPHLRDVMWATAQSVFHFGARDLRSFRPPEFPVWFAEIGSSGWYGFPVNVDGVVKVADHGPGRRVIASDSRTTPDGEEARYRAFLRETIPSLADAPVVATRVCLYCDTFDYAFWMDHDPHHPGLIVAAGDSGHGFKFAPILGDIIADVVERIPNPWAERYRWREKPAEFAAGARS